MELQGRSVSSSLNRVMVGFTCVAVLLAFWLWFQSTAVVLQQESYRALMQLMARRTESESPLFLHAQDNVERIHDELVRRLDTTTPEFARTEFHRLAQQSEDGIWRVRPEFDHHETLPSLYIQHDAELSPSLYVRAVASYGLLAERGPAVVPPYYSVYMDFVEKGLMVYSPFVNWGAGATRETDNFNYPTMLGSDPERNPEREVFWTPVYFDAEAKTWMVSVIEPLDWQGEWVGTVGQDVAIDHLMGQTLGADSNGSYDLILSADGRLIAHPEFSNQITATGGDLSLENLQDPMLLRVNQLVSTAAEYPTVIDDDELDNLYGVAKLSGPDWLLVTVYPKSIVTERALSVVTMPAVALLMLVIGALALLRVLMHLLVLRPLEYLDVAVEKLSEGETQLEIPLDVDNEFGRLARSFEALSRELEQSESSLQEAQSDWQHTFNTVLEFIIIMDENYIIKQANRAFCNLFDMPLSDVVGKHRKDLLSGGNVAEFDEVMGALVESREPVQLNVFSEQLKLNLEVILAPLMDHEGQLVGIVEVGRNVTEQRLLEEQLRQSQKMDAVGQLAGGVAHDFNNLLQIIMGYAEMLEHESVKQGEPNTAVEQILTAGHKAAGLTQQLLAFSRRQVMQTAQIDINTIVESTLALVGRLIESNVQVKFQNSDERMTVEVDRNLMEQVMINLCLNARDAMPEGGVLQIGIDKVAAVDAPEGLASSSLGYAHVWVADSGCGISAENQERIFEPFFTTKEINKGTGLGLATAYGILEQHRGTIQVQSKLGEGAKFSIYLPLVESNGHLVESAHPNVMEAVTGACILVAEDDSQIRDLLRLMLSKAGYEVLTANDGVHALQVFEANADRIQLLLLDMMMPELSGDQVITRIRDQEIEVPCLIASGYSEDQHVLPVLDDPLVRFINKPFKQPELLAAIRELLDHQSAGNISQN